MENVTVINFAHFDPVGVSPWRRTAQPALRDDVGLTSERSTASESQRESPSLARGKLTVSSCVHGGVAIGRLPGWERKFATLIE